LRRCLEKKFYFFSSVSTIDENELRKGPMLSKQTASGHLLTGVGNVIQWKKHFEVFPMIHNIVFDMGQVLIQWRPDLLIRQFGVPEDDAALLQEAVFSSVEWIQLDRGSISQEDALTAMCRELPERLHAAAGELVRGWWKRPLVPIPGMEDLIAELKNLGYGIYLLSNASSQIHDYFRRIPGSQYFDGMIVSADWKLLKPQHEIFEVLFREYGLSPASCFFIDDLNINIEGAREVGMPGTVFNGGMARLRKSLRTAGVPVHP